MPKWNICSHLERRCHSMGKFREGGSPDGISHTIRVIGKPAANRYFAGKETVSNSRFATSCGSGAYPSDALCFRPELSIQRSMASIAG
jgi:hypothetical protein